MPYAKKPAPERMEVLRLLAVKLYELTEEILAVHRAEREEQVAQLKVDQPELFR